MMAQYVIKNTDLIISMPSDFCQLNSLLAHIYKDRIKKPPGAFPRLWPMVPTVGEGQLAEEGREEDLGGQGSWGTRVAPQGSWVGELVTGGWMRSHWIGAWGLG